MTLFMAVVILTVLVTPLEAQWLDYRTPHIPRTADGKPNLAAPAPRTADGKPDLTGLWEVFSPDTAIGNVLLRKPGDLQPADIQPWVQALLQQRAENFGIDNPRYKCLPDGPNYSTEQGFKRILQTPSMIAILQEDLTFRQIHMDGRALETDPNPSWMGYSVGRWEGDTLVVESNGFNDRTWLIQGYPHTEAMRMTERFRRTDFGHLVIAVTFDDPKAYNKAWTLCMANSKMLRKLAIRHAQASKTAAADSDRRDRDRCRRSRESGSQQSEAQHPGTADQMDPVQGPWQSDLRSRQCSGRVRQAGRSDDEGELQRARNISAAGDRQRRPARVDTRSDRDGEPERIGPEPLTGRAPLLFLKHCRVVQLLALSIRASSCDRASLAVFRNHVSGNTEGFALRLAVTWYV